MCIVIEKIREYIDNNSARDLQQKCSVWAGTLYSLLKKENKKYYKEQLDKIYDFFWLEKDDFYFEKIQKYKWNTYNPLWELLRNRRKELWLTLEQVAKKIKWTDRHLRRLEAWEVFYSENNYYMRELLKLYEFSKIEQNLILTYVNSLWIIIEINKNKRKIFNF